MSGTPALTDKHIAAAGRPEPKAIGLQLEFFYPETGPRDAAVPISMMFSGLML